MLKYKIFTAFLLSLGTLGLYAQTISEHGYRYIHHTQKGGQKPAPGEAIHANVDIYVNNTLLSTSKKNPGGTYRYDIAKPEDNPTHYPPLHDAALMMGKGDSMTIFQTIDDNMRNYLPPDEKQAKEIRFEVVLLDIITLEQKAAAAKQLEASVKVIGDRVKAKTKAYASGLLTNEMTTYPSGLKVLVEDLGKGAQIQEGEVVQVHYYGCLKDGYSFDNSFSRRQPLQFPAGVGQMIKGFDEAILYLAHGAKAYFFIPSELGYGDQDAANGTIPANSELIFYVEVL
jgi:FKBP-type peptidyl-prolyl cis-trans isomerase